MEGTLIIVAIVLSIIILSLLLVRNEHLDRFSPLLREKVSYTKVPKDTQGYRNITVYSKNEGKKDYKSDFLGYDPIEEYVKVNHEGERVRSIEYITKDIPSFLKRGDR